MARIRQSDVDEVKARTNIGDIVGERVALKSAGVGSLKGLCPFHDERSPSFHVRPQVGYYHCFGSLRHQSLCNSCQNSAGTHGRAIVITGASTSDSP